MKKTICLVLIILLFCSCSTQWVQVLKFKGADNIKYPNAGENLVYENDSISIIYSFWGEDGRFSFAFVNKLNVPLYIDWKKCSFIKNGSKLDYWQEGSTNKGVVLGSTVQQNPNEIFLNNLSLVYSKVEENERITFIPPKSSIYRITYKIQDTPIVLSDTASNTYIAGKKKNKMNLLTSSETFCKTNSPITLRNFITYSLSESFDQMIYVDNSFHVYNLYEVRLESFEKKVHDFLHNTYTYIQYHKDPTWFYIKFEYQ